MKIECEAKMRDMEQDVSLQEKRVGDKKESRTKDMKQLKLVKETVI